MAKPTDDNLMDKIISLCKRRGFVFPGSEIYGGLANSWDYGPVGVELKNNIKQLWWKRFVRSRDDVVGIDASLIMNPKVWEASGHLSTFNDPLVECKKCHTRFRADQIDASKPCENCGAKDSFTEAHMFNLMLKTFLGPAEEAANVVYFRPETAQAMFVDFKNVLQTTRKKLPFGIAQIGKAFRNEITPGNFIFRTREFEQMEIEYFIRPPKTDEDWQSVFEMWRKEMMEWIKEVGIDTGKVHELEVSKDKLAHYSKRTIDLEYEFPFGIKELYGLAYRTDFDLKNHMEKSGSDLQYMDPKTGEKFIPHVIEPTFGSSRIFLALLTQGYAEEEGRLVLKLNKRVAPYRVAVFPLVKNKEDLVNKAKEIYNSLLEKGFSVDWDDRGNIGKRYFAQDEIGTPYCITVDYQTLEDGTVTIRERDTMTQERVSISDISSKI